LKSSPLLLAVAPILRSTPPEDEIKLFLFAIFGYKIPLISRIVLIKHRPRAKKTLTVTTKKKGRCGGYRHLEAKSVKYRYF
jgi:hypothetical protein